MNAFIGTSGWSIPDASRRRFPKAGSHLERYASQLNAAEINSSFYRPHRASTYERWASAVPEQFRFAVKMPKSITHDMRLVAVSAEIDRFLDETTGLGAKLGPLLMQLPGSFEFSARKVARFFAMLRRRHAGTVVCEPRNPSWFSPGADRVLSECRIARVAADPPRCSQAAEPGPWGPLFYYRLHGSPVMYRSAYSDKVLANLSRTIRTARCACWCIFDNTMFGAATQNALELQVLLERGQKTGSRTEPKGCVHH